MKQNAAIDSINNFLQVEKREKHPWSIIYFIKFTMSSNYFILLLNTNISNNKIKNVYARYAKASSNLKFPDKYSGYITIVS